MTGSEMMDRVADLVTAIGLPRFGNEFYRLFDETLGIEECTVFSFPQPDRPNRLVVEGNSETTRQKALALASDYVAGGYRVDPNLRQLGHGASTAIYVAQPEAIADRDFRLHYYDNADVAHELVMLGRTGDTIYYSSFYRRSRSKRFEQDDLAVVHSLSKLVLNMLHRHHEIERALGDGADDAAMPPAAALQSEEQRERTYLHMRDVLLSGSHNLSRREAEICARIVLGYSTLAISLNLGISPNTVATHRKRGYAKLGICSQNELFVRYFNSVRGFEAGTAH